MTLQEIKDYLNKETRVKNEDGSETIRIRVEPWQDWFLKFAEEHETWCEFHLTEANFEDAKNQSTTLIKRIARIAAEINLLLMNKTINGIIQRHEAP